MEISWKEASNRMYEAFLQSLLNHPHDPSYPISASIYTPKHPSFFSVLFSYMRNLRFNNSATRKPFLILTAMHESHVQAAVVCARKHGVFMKTRSGGHDYEGVSYISDKPFFILDMFNLRDIKVDVENETAWVQTGATLGEVFYRISEKSKVHGFPAGVCPTVGVGGHVSGGGYGNLMRKYGLSSDNVVDAKLVDVNGRILDRQSMGEDLFWAICGGGAVSFGVALAYKIKLVRVPEVVTVFRIEKTLEDNALDAVDRWQHVAHKIDDDLFIRLIHDVVKSTAWPTGKTLRATFIALFLGDSGRLLSLMNRSFPEMGLRRSDCLEVSWLESVLFWRDYEIGKTTPEIVLSREADVLVHLKRRSDIVQEPIPRTGLEAMFKKLIELESVILTFNPYGGRMSEIPPTASPFPHRAGNLWLIQYAANWNEEGAEAAKHYIDLTRKLYEFMAPFVSKNPRVAFLNYRDLDLGINHHEKDGYFEGRAYGIKYYKENFNRLVQIKTRVDPDNFFRNEQSVPVMLEHTAGKLIRSTKL